VPLEGLCLLISRCESPTLADLKPPESTALEEGLGRGALLVGAV
jgi:hypothetical protein